MAILELLHNHPIWFLLIFLNVVAFLLMGVDKLLAKAHLYRIPERILMFFAICFGALGLCLGMWLFRHKTKKAKFCYGGPVLLLLQVVAIYFALTTDWMSVF